MNKWTMTEYIAVRADIAEFSTLKLDKCGCCRIKVEITPLFHYYLDKAGHKRV